VYGGWIRRRAAPRLIRRDRGFTLIEVLVALAILAITMGFALRIFSGALASAADSEHQQAALTLAEALLARAGTEIALHEGDIAGQITEGFTWRMHMTQDDRTRGCAVPGCVAPLRAMLVQVSVGWVEQHRARQVQLSTLRLAPAREP